MNRLSASTTVAAAAGAVAISLAGAGVASAKTGVVIGPVHPQIDTLVGGTLTNLRSTGGVVTNPGSIAAGDAEPWKIPHPSM